MTVETDESRADRLEKMAVDAGQTALRTFFVLNGGAAIATLAFLGALLDKDRVEVGDITTAADGLVWFAGGVILCSLALAGSYLTNLWYANASRSGSSKKWTVASVLNHITIVLALLSVVAFGWGAYQVREAVVDIGKKETARKEATPLRRNPSVVYWPLNGTSRTMVQQVASLTGMSLSAIRENSH